MDVPVPIVVNLPVPMAMEVVVHVRRRSEGLGSLRCPLPRLAVGIDAARWKWWLMPLMAFDVDGL